MKKGERKGRRDRIYYSFNHLGKLKKYKEDDIIHKGVARRYVIKRQRLMLAIRRGSCWVLIGFVKGGGVIITRTIAFNNSKTAYIF